MLLWRLAALLVVLSAVAPWFCWENENCTRLSFGLALAKRIQSRLSFRVKLCAYFNNNVIPFLVHVIYHF